MTSIFREVEIGWAGKVHAIKPTMHLLNRIEQKVSLSQLASSLANGHPKLSHVATTVAIMLQSAGVAVTDEEVYAELMNADSQDAIYGMAQAIVIAAFPYKEPSGNVSRPSKKTSGRKSKA